jgi:hypothetical protein
MYTFGLVGFWMSPKIPYTLVGNWQWIDEKIEMIKRLHFFAPFVFSFSFIFAIMVCSTLTCLLFTF